MYQSCKKRKFMTNTDVKQIINPHFLFESIMCPYNTPYNNTNSQQSISVCKLDCILFPSSMDAQRVCALLSLWRFVKSGIYIPDIYYDHEYLRL